MNGTNSRGGTKGRELCPILSQTGPENQTLGQKIRPHVPNFFFVILAKLGIILNYSNTKYFTLLHD